MKIPKGEKAWVQYQDVHGNPKFVITTKADSRSIHYLYEIHDGTLVKLGKAPDPTTLETKYGIRKKLFC